MRDWNIGEWSDHLGYDCMTAGVRVGPVVLDGADYGQKRCGDLTPETKAKMMEDARLISAAPQLADALWALVDWCENMGIAPSEINTAKAALAKAGRSS